jgi:hypothetical protein
MGPEEGLLAIGSGLKGAASVAGRSLSFGRAAATFGRGLSTNIRNFVRTFRQVADEAAEALTEARKAGAGRLPCAGKAITDSRVGSIRGNPANRLIDVPDKNGRLTRRYVRITKEDAAAYRQAQADRLGLLYNEPTPAGMSDEQIRAWRHQQMNAYRRQWLDEFYRTRKY